MKLSIIIPCLNAELTLAGQLEALARQQWHDWEVIVADNGSTDGSRRVVERFRGRLPGLKWIDASQRRGAGYARNLAVRHASGEALLFCDADDEVADGWLTAMGRALQEHDFVASRLEPTKLSDPKLLATRRCPQQHGLQHYTYPPFLPHAGTCGLAVKRNVHEAVGGFDESFMRLQDTDYCWRIQIMGVPLQFVPDALVHMRFRGDLHASYRQAREWGEYNVKLYKKYRAHGMPKLSFRRGVNTWVRLARRLPREWPSARRNRWVWDFNWALGRLRGTIKHGVMSL